MSFARAKITRFNEKPNPHPNGAGGLKSKSQIPKISKSIQQPQSPKDSPRPISSPSQQKRPKNGTGEGPNVGKPCNLTAVKENSIHSDDYKDALDDKTEVDNVDSLRDSTQISITMRESLASRSSNSGIPLPLKNSTSKQSTKTTPRSRPDQSGECKLVASPKRTLELQFLTKKKRLDQLKKELELRQKPVFELYETLIQIKKKLEESGKMVPLEALKIVDYENLLEKPLSPPSETALSSGEIIKNEVAELTAEFMKTLKEEMGAIPQTCIDLGSYLLKQREEIVNYLGEIKEKDPTIIVEEFKQDSNRLNQMVDETVLRQTHRIERVMGNITSLFEKSNIGLANQIIHDLERKVKLQEQEIAKLTNELIQKEQQLKELREGRDESSHKLMDENHGLRERIKTLESELQAKKRKLSDHGVSTKSYEQKIEVLTKHMQDLEKAKKEADAKVNEVNAHLRTLQNKMKFMEQKWRDEKEELLKNHKGEHAILEKLTAERQALDTRVQLMNNILDEQKKDHVAEEERLRKELLAVKEQVVMAGVEKQILEDKLKSMQEEVATLSLQQQQAVDVIKNTMKPQGEAFPPDKIAIENEKLNTEILALRVSLRAAQDRIEAYTTEKMRFIDSIEKLNCSGDAKECLGKELVQKEEAITRLEQERATLMEKIEEHKMKEQQLNAQIEALKAGAIVNNLDHIPHDTHDLQSMLEEGKAKLQKALTKSLDNEQKLIRYEHDMNQQKKQLNDMENLLKVRDGLISMLKVKKDELVMENDSLHRYSEEIRQLLFDTKEELKQKVELLDEANNHLDDKSKLCYKLEKRIRDLETTLSETNEKRYKLQDTVGCMEKELQSTKAHINQIAEMQTRYEIGMPQLNTDIKSKQTAYQQYTKPPNTFQDQERRQQNARATTIASNIYRSRSPNRQYYPTTLQNSNQVPMDTKNIAQLTSATVTHDFKQSYTQAPQNQIETPYIGDSSHMRKMYYYVPERNIQNYANYIRKTSQIASNPMYGYYRSYYRPLTQSLVNFESNTDKIRNTKRNSSPVLYSQRHAKIQTSAAPKYSSATQTDVQKAQNKSKEENFEFIARPKMLQQNSSDNACKTVFDATKEQLDPYKLCCDMVSKERTDLEAPTCVEVPETKKRERKEFIAVVNKLSEYDNRTGREALGLGKEFTPIIFGGIRKYKVLDSGSLMWCQPTKEMQINNMIITNDIKAHFPTRAENVSEKSKKTLNNIIINTNSSEIKP